MGQNFSQIDNCLIVYVFLNMLIKIMYDWWVFLDEVMFLQQT